ncbi:Gamma-interferon-responsive lysosomal thiol protein [Pseudocercospora fuligena]|uniref:Gamma-interferon-responsive lysosomal thiol protein n=1 Tax=Pseudocercospora fuligena TaxID=685502 RepID=A0A8H6VFF8_9PEZI|nr:Gamma-interferon-responsive lysosomal thiol protein [Pseudocercospora fuligena]
MDTEKQPLLSPVIQPNAENAPDPEPSLSDLQQNVFKAQRAYMRAWSRTTSGKWHKRIMISVTTLLVSIMLFGTLLIAFTDEAEGEPWYPSSSRVPLEAHIMSKCPDAKDCLHDLILPTMQKVGDKVDFRLSYIGNATDHDDGVECKHGQEECLGNIIELCAMEKYPDPKIYLGFTMCLTREYQRIPERALIEDCALEHGLDMDKIQECTVNEDGALSVDLLKASFNRTRSAGVTKSCTVRLNNEIRCIRDGGEWKDCPGGHTVDDLVKDILDLSSNAY